MEYARSVHADPEAKEAERRGPLPARLVTPLRVAFEEAAEGVRTSAAVVRAAPLEPPRTGRLARVGYGFALPLAAMRALLRDPVERRRFLVQAGARAFVVFALTGAIAGAGVYATIKAGLLQADADFKTKATIVAAVLSSFYATLTVMETIVIALTHEYDAQIGRRAALRAGVAPEDEESKPRVRVDFAWIKKRIKRALRGYRVYLIGIPAFSIVYLLPGVGPSLYGLLLALWSLYWIVVLAASKTAAAWTEEGHAPDPWYLRVWEALTTYVPGFRWGLPRAYGRLWRKHSEAVFSPCKAVEDAPYAMLGLGLCRALLGVPGVYLFLRPFIPVAAAHIIATSRRPELPETAQ